MARSPRNRTPRFNSLAERLSNPTPRFHDPGTTIRQTYQIDVVYMIQGWSERSRTEGYMSVSLSDTADRRS
ncbi:hypothetical protein GCM10022207_89390 [Streptomyces lannensis]|uniref:Uncharacterized protein n=1 Tax=Streptomyces lannensis TaxID=766498 RepID=A0ABP7LRT0_9ACTN